jgi:hypothetical protein
MFQFNMAMRMAEQQGGINGVQDMADFIYVTVFNGVDKPFP